MDYNLDTPQMNDAFLESALFDIGGDAHGDFTLMAYRRLKYNSNRRIYEEAHPLSDFVILKHSKGYPSYMYPVYLPSTTLVANLLDCRPVFNSECVMISAQAGCYKFIYFDPGVTHISDYNNAIGSFREIYCGIMGVSGAYPADKDDYDNGFTSSSPNYDVGRTKYVKGCKFPIYEAHFAVATPLGYTLDAVAALSYRIDTVKILVKSLFNNTGTIEMITNFENRRVPDYFSQSFFFIGHL